MTTLRCSRAGAVGQRVAHEMQKRASAAFSHPQFGQAAMAEESTSERAGARRARCPQRASPRTQDRSVRTDFTHGSGAGRNSGTDRVVRLALVDQRGEELSEEHVTRANPRDGLDERRERPDTARLPADPKQGEASVLERDQDVARAHLGDRVKRHEEVVVVLELLSDELLGLALVRRDEERAGFDAETERVALRVEDDADVTAPEVADGVRIERRRHLARERPRKDDEVRTAREVVQLLHEHLELDRRDLRSPLVDLGVRPVGRIDDCGRRARLGGDAHEVVEDRLGGQLLDDPRSGTSAGEPGRDDRHLEDLQRPGDVDALAARERQHLARAVAEPDLEHGHGERPVERRVRRHGDDHVSIPHRLRAVCVACHFAFAQTLASGTAAAATRADDATSRSPS